MLIARKQVYAFLWIVWRYNKAVDAKKERETKATSGYGAKGPRGGGFKSVSNSNNELW